MKKFSGQPTRIREFWVAKKGGGGGEFGTKNPKNMAGQIIATLGEVTPNGGVVRESPPKSP